MKEISLTVMLQWGGGNLLPDRFHPLASKPIGTVRIAWRLFLNMAGLKMLVVQKTFYNMQSLLTFSLFNTSSDCMSAGQLTVLYLSLRCVSTVNVFVCLFCISACRQIAYPFDEMG